MRDMIKWPIMQTSIGGKDSEFLSSEVLSTAELETEGHHGMIKISVDTLYRITFAAKRWVKGPWLGSYWRESWNQCERMTVWTRDVRAEVLDFAYVWRWICNTSGRVDESLRHSWLLYYIDLYRLSIPHLKCLRSNVFKFGVGRNIYISIMTWDRAQV